jgi:hypothetical protein
MESQELHLIKSTNMEVNQNQLIIAKADKGNTLITLHKDDYNKK